MYFARFFEAQLTSLLFHSSRVHFLNNKKPHCEAGHKIFNSVFEILQFNHLFKGAIS